MEKIKVELLKPLDGHPIGAELEFDKTDFERLEGYGAVKAIKAPANKMAATPENKSDTKTRAAK